MPVDAMATLGTTRNAIVGGRRIPADHSGFIVESTGDESDVTA